MDFNEAHGYFPGSVIVKEKPVTDVLPVREIVDRPVQVVPQQIQLVLSIQVSIGPITVSYR